MFKNSTLPFFKYFACLVLVLSIFGFETTFAQQPVDGFPYSDSFKNSTSPGTVFGGTPTSATLTSGNGTDAVGAGYLRLTTNQTNQTGFARNLRTFTSSNGLAISFEYYAHSRASVEGADGLTFFLFNSAGVTSASNTFTIGQFGGSLGYAQSNSGPGVSNAYIGIGFDEFGNFANGQAGRAQGFPGLGTGRLNSSITLRGDGNGTTTGGTTNYEWLRTIQTSSSTAMGALPSPQTTFFLPGEVDGRNVTTGGPQGLDNLDIGYRKIEINMVPILGGYNINVYVTEGGVGPGNAGIRHHVIQDHAYTTGVLPTNLSYGFAASTGASTNFHEIRAIDIAVPASVQKLPVATAASATTPEDMNVNVDLTLYAYDENGNNSLNWSGGLDLDPITPGTQNTYNDPGKGTFTSLGNGNVTFTPVGNWSGTASTSYSVYDIGNPSPASPVIAPAQSNSASLTVTVNPVNDPPTTANASVATNEDAIYTFQPTDFPFTDAIEGDIRDGIVLVSNPSAGTLTYNNSIITPGTVITAASFTAASLTYQPPANQSGSPTTTFQFRVRDNGGTANGGLNTSVASATMTINVLPVNDPPTTANASVATNEDAIYTFQPTDFPFTDAIEGDIRDGIVLVSNPSAGTLTYNNSIITPGTVITAASFTAASLTYQPPANQSGSPTTTFQFRVRDNGGTANGGLNTSVASATMTINVLPVNDPPTTANASVATNEDAIYTFQPTDFPFTDAIEGDIRDGIVLVSNPSAGTLTYNNSIITPGTVITAASFTAASLTYQPPANQSGSPTTTFQFRVRDNGGTANGGLNTSVASATMTINVLPVNDPPTTANASVATNEDAIYTFQPTDFPFTDAIEGDIRDGIVLVSNPSAGTLTYNNSIITPGTVITAASFTAASLTYQPPANQSGSPTTTFQFRVRDNGGTANGGLNTSVASATMTINVLPVNDPPTTANASVATNEDAIYTFQPTDFPFTDAIEGDIRDGIVLVSNPSAGTLTYNNSIITPGTVITAASFTAASLTYQPPANQSGSPTTTFQFRVRDNGGTANGGLNTSVASATMTINVLPVNDPPTTANASVATNEDAIYTFQPTDFPFTDAIEGDIRDGIVLVSNPSAGTLTYNNSIITPGTVITAASFTAASLTYQPPANQSGSPTTTFQFRVRDNGGTANGGLNTSIASATMTINVNPVNDPPASASKTVSTNAGFAYTFALSDFFFTDEFDTPANNFIQVKITTLPASGTLKINGASITAGDFINAASITANQLTFTPASGTGSTSFTFQVRDDGGTADGGIDLSIVPATMTINVVAINNAPVAQASSITTNEDINHLFTASEFIFTDNFDTPANGLLAVQITNLPGSGTLMFNGASVTTNQFISAASFTSASFIYIPPANASGSPTTTFNFKVQDNGGTNGGGADISAAAATMTVYILPVNDPPTTANASVATNEDAIYTFQPTDFPFTDAIEGDIRDGIVLVSNPSAGTLTYNNSIITPGTVITAASFTAASLTYQPPANQSGSPTTTFQFRVRDNGGTANGGLNTSVASATMTINVLPVNDPPTTANASVATNEDAIYTFQPTDFPFTDAIEGDIRDGIVLVSNPSAGTLTYNNSIITPGTVITAASFTAASLTYQPPANQSGSPTTTFQFRVRDNGGTANGGLNTSVASATMTINVLPVNDPPTTANASVATNEDAIYTFQPTDFPFTDAIEGDIRDGIVLVSNPSAGTLTYNNSIITPGTVITAASFTAASLTYQPPANQSGSPTTTFQFRVRDNGGTANGGLNTSVASATMTINVLPVSDAPAGTDKPIAIMEDTPYTLTVSDFGFTDPFDSPADAFTSVIVTTLPTAGSLTLNGNPVTASQTIAVGDFTTFVYHPVLNAHGTPNPSFTFQVVDNGTGQNTDLSPNTISFNITPVNDAPAGTDKLIAITEDTSYTLLEADFGFTDAFDSPANTFASVIITTIPSSGTLKLSGIAVTASQTIPVSSFPNLVYTPASNATGIVNPGFTFQVVDNGTGQNTDLSPNTISFNVSPVNDVPVAVADSYTVDRGGRLTVTAPGVLVNDSDVEGGLTAILVTGPANGELSLNPSGSFIYDHTNLSSTSDSFSYKVNDGTVDGNTVIVSITINATNSSPVAAPDTYTIAEDLTLTVPSGTDLGLLSNDSDPDNNTPLVVTGYSIGGVSHTLGTNTTIAGVGTINIATNGSFVFTPEPNFNGTVPQITYTMQDSGTPAGSATSTVNITVTDVNDAPIAQAQTVNGTEDKVYTFKQADFPFTDTENNSLAAVLITSIPATGTIFNNGTAVTAGTLVDVASINSGSLTYEAPADANGSPLTFFDFQVQDNGSNSNGGVNLSVTPIQITINFAPVNDAPSFTKGANQSVLTTAGAQSVPTWATALSKGPADESGQTLTFEVSNSDNTLFSAQPAIDANGTLTYTPAGVAGTATVTVILKDNGGVLNSGIDTSAPQTFTIVITAPAATNNPPVAANDSATTPEDTPVTILPLPNDSDPDSDPLTITSATVPTGTVTIDQGNKLIYTPPADYTGTAVITYQISDGKGGTATATVTVTVTENRSIAINVTEVCIGDVPWVQYTVTGTGFTPAANSVRIQWKKLDGTIVRDLTGQPLTGQLLWPGAAVDGNGKPTAWPGWIFVNGQWEQIADGLRPQMKLHIIVNPENEVTVNYPPATPFCSANPNSLPVAVADTYNVVKGGTLDVAAAGVLSNDTDADQNPLTAVKVSNPANGTLTFSSNGGFVYIHNGGASTTDSFTYYANDSRGNSNTTTVTINISAVNAPPLIADVPKTGTKDIPVPFTVTDFSSKFTDDDPLVKVKIVTVPTVGSLLYNGVPVTPGLEIPVADLTKLTFVPPAGFTGGPISFQYNSTDGKDYAPNPRNVNITINSLPVAVPDMYTTTKGGTLTVALPGVLTNDTDADGNSLNATKVSDPANGTVSLNANGSFVYTHNGGSSTSDSFSYKVNDGISDGNTTTVTITIITVNAPPVVYELPKIGTGFTPIPFTPEDFKGKYNDPNGDPLVKIRITGLPPVGVLKLNGVPVTVGQEIPVANLGGLTFEPPVNWSGTTTFPWNGSDGTVYANNPANVTLTVALAGDPTAKIGLAKSLVSVIPALNATYDVKFIFTAVNYGLNGLENVSIRDNLALAFGGAEVTVKNILAFGNLKANNAFNGISVTELLLPTSKLSAGEEARIELIINVKAGINGGTFQNTAVAEATSAVNGIKVTDVSTNGLKPDPLGAADVSPSDATPIQLDAKPTYVPEGFSPNGDGQNDKFVIQNANGKHVSLEIYNRWGNRVYKSNDYRNDWGGEVTEGFFLGRDIPDGTYYYIIIIDKKDKYAGFITINR